MTNFVFHFYRSLLATFLAFALVTPAQTRRAESFDVIIRGGTVYDGTGGAPKRTDVGIKGDRIAAIGNLKSARAATVIDATGLAVAPGFINMLSHSESSLITDGRSQGELRQGVTTQIFGEGSMGPLSDEMKQRRVSGQGDVKFEIPWTTLAEYLTYLEKHGISQNAASFVSATTVREYVIGLEDKAPTSEQLDRMRELVRKEMEAGALGVTTALIYPPAFPVLAIHLTLVVNAATVHLARLFDCVANLRSELRSAAQIARVNPDRYSVTFESQAQLFDKRIVLA